MNPSFEVKFLTLPEILKLSNKDLQKAWGALDVLSDQISDEKIHHYVMLLELIMNHRELERKVRGIKEQIKQAKADAYNECRAECSHLYECMALMYEFIANKYGEHVCDDMDRYIQQETSK